MKDHFLLSLLKPKKEEVELLNFVIGYGALMHREYVSKQLLPHILNMDCGDVLPRSPCPHPHKKLILGESKNEKNPPKNQKEAKK